MLRPTWRKENKPSTPLPVKWFAIQSFKTSMKTNQRKLTNKLKQSIKHV